MAVAYKNQNTQLSVSTKSASNDSASIQTTASGTQYVPSTTVLFSRKQLDGLIETVRAKRRSAK